MNMWVRRVRLVFGNRRGFTLAELLVVIAVLGLAMAAVLNVFMTGSTIGLTNGNKAEAQQTARGAMLMEEDLRMVGYGCPVGGCIPPGILPAGCPPPPAQSNIICATPTAVTFWGDLTNSTTTLSAQANPNDTSLTLANAQLAAGFTPGDLIYLSNYNQFATFTVTSVAGTKININPKVVTVFPAESQVGRPKAVTYSWNGVNTLSKNSGTGGGLQVLATGIQAFQLSYFDTNDTLIAPANLSANLLKIRRIVITMTAQSAAALDRGTFSLSSSVRPRNL